MARSTGLLATATVGAFLIGCVAPSTSTRPGTPYPLTLHESPGMNSTGVYVHARAIDGLNVYAFESTEAMFEFIRAANKDRAVTAITGTARNPGYHVVEIHVGDTTVPQHQKRARGMLDELAAEFAGFNVAGGPVRVVGPDGITAMWMPCLESVYVGANADYYGALTDVTTAFSFETEDGAVNAARYVADVYETRVSAGDDGRYALLLTRTMKRGDAKDEAIGAEEWVGWLGGRFERVEAAE